MDVLTIQMGWIGGNVAGAVPPVAGPGVQFRLQEWQLQELFRRRREQLDDDEAAMVLILTEMVEQ